MCNIRNIDVIFTENCIDGAALAALPEDIEEFKILVPQSGLRIRLKSVIKKYADTPAIMVMTHMLNFTTVLIIFQSVDFACTMLYVYLH